MKAAVGNTGIDGASCNVSSCELVPLGGPHGEAVRQRVNGSLVQPSRKGGVERVEEATEVGVVLCLRYITVGAGCAVPQGTSSHRDRPRKEKMSTFRLPYLR